MDRFLLALTLGLFSHPGGTSAGGPAAGGFFRSTLVPLVAPVVAAVDPAREAAQEQADRAQLEKPPVPAERVREARKQVRRQTETGEGGKVLHRFTFPDGAVVEFTDRPKGSH